LTEPEQQLEEIEGRHASGSIDSLGVTRERPPKTELRLSRRLALALALARRHPVPL
jgi:hypothetical protein